MRYKGCEVPHATCHCRNERNMVFSDIRACGTPSRAMVHASINVFHSPGIMAKKWLCCYLLCFRTCTMHLRLHHCCCLPAEAAEIVSMMGAAAAGTHSPVIQGAGKRPRLHPARQHVAATIRTQRMMQTQAGTI